MKKYCTVCDQEQPHKHIGYQPGIIYENGFHLYNCLVCKTTNSFKKIIPDSEIEIIVSEEPLEQETQS